MFIYGNEHCATKGNSVAGIAARSRHRRSDELTYENTRDKESSEHSGNVNNAISRSGIVNTSLGIRRDPHESSEVAHSPVPGRRCRASSL